VCTRTKVGVAAWEGNLGIRERREADPELNALLGATIGVRLENAGCGWQIGGAGARGASAPLFLEQCPML
jgi:hypothetical protein